jgi:hypothetical protein
MKSIDETELIAYHLRELSPLRTRAIRLALERDPELAAESEAIAATLRLFEAAPTPTVDTATLDRNWQSLRPSLAVFTPQPKHTSWRWPIAIGAGLASLALAIGIVGYTHRATPLVTIVAPPSETASTPLPPATADETSVLSELHTNAAAPHRYNNRPGPLTTAPVGRAAADPALLAHLDSAERLLTEVSHVEGPLPQETRTEAHRLLLENALYQHTAQARGDLATASVMDDLGRVLVSLDADPPQSARGADTFRLQMNVGGVLFDLRILHHNQSSQVE